MLEQTYIDNVIKKSQILIIAMEHCNPLAMIRVLGKMGLKPDYIAIRHKAPVASSSRYVNKVHFVENDEEAYHVLIKEYGDTYKRTGYKPFLLLGDDSTVELFETHYDELKDIFISFNAGGNGRLKLFMDKNEILECAKRHNVQVLPSEVVKLGDFPKVVTYPIITKAISPNSGAWKDDVFICNSEEELKEAYEHIKSPLVLLQKFIEKKTEIALEGYSIHKGKDIFIGDQCTYLYNIKGYYSPYYSNQPFKNDCLKEKLNAMLEEIGFEGLFEIEFLVDKDDELYFSEINFRNSPWSYSAGKAGNPLPYLWCLSMITGVVDEPKEFTPFNSMVEPFDYAQRVDTGKMSLPQWLKDFKQTECTHYYDSEDLGPFDVMIENWDILK